MVAPTTDNDGYRYLPMNVVYHKASPREKLARNATDEGSREAAWNKRYRKAEHKNLIRRLSLATYATLLQGEGLT